MQTECLIGRVIEFFNISIIDFDIVVHKKLIGGVRITFWGATCARFHGASIVGDLLEKEHRRKFLERVLRRTELLAINCLTQNPLLSHWCAWNQSIIRPALPPSSKPLPALLPVPLPLFCKNDRVHSNIGLKKISWINSQDELLELVILSLH